MQGRASSECIRVVIFKNKHCVSYLCSTVRACIVLPCNLFSIFFHLINIGFAYEVLFLSVLLLALTVVLSKRGRIHSIRPKQRHYSCMVSMLSRAGRLREAEEFLVSMPCQPEANAWSERLSKVAEYVLMSNSYASRWAMGRCDEPERDQEEWGLQLDGAEKLSASVLFTG